MAPTSDNSALLIFRKLCVLGRGASGQVWKATCDLQGTGGVVALKQSRVSSRVSQPLLQYESRIIKLMEGHRAFPKFYGYMRIAHFECIAMQLLGPNLWDLKKKNHNFSTRNVLVIADQMLSALAHLHGHGLIHRDIKPQNMVLSLDAERVILIDFGIAVPIHSGKPRREDPMVARVCMIGTLSWVSLNTHYGFDPSPRDDLESLAYSLFSLLRNDLPWHKNASNHSSPVFRQYAHVCQKKLEWPGSRLAVSYPEEFGQLLDYARKLEFNDMPEYVAWQSNFRALFERSGFGLLDEKMSLEPIIAPEKITEPPTPSQQLVPTEECIVQPGQFVYVHILPRLTVEGYTGQANDESYWHDPTLSGDEWKTKLYPAAVLGTSWDSNGYYRILVIPIGRGRASTQRYVNIVNDIAFPTPGTDAVALVDWPLEDAYFYAFPCLQTFYTLPGSTSVPPTQLKLSGDDVKKLVAKFNAPAPRSTYIETDLKAYSRMQERQSFHKYNIYAEFTPMTVESLVAQHAAKGPSDALDMWLVEWEGERCWFDELVKINRRRMADAGWEWTGDACNDGHDVSCESHDNSYMENSRFDWSCQPERDTCMTHPGKLTDVDILTNVKVVRAGREPAALVEE